MLWGVEHKAGLPYGVGGGSVKTRHGTIYRDVPAWVGVKEKSPLMTQFPLGDVAFFFFKRHVTAKK